MIERYFCERCERETRQLVQKVVENWQNDEIPDEDLSQGEVISRLNGDVTYAYTCQECCYRRFVL